MLYSKDEANKAMHTARDSFIETQFKDCFDQIKEAAEEGDNYTYYTISNHYDGIRLIYALINLGYSVKKYVTKDQYINLVKNEDINNWWATGGHTIIINWE